MNIEEYINNKVVNICSIRETEGDKFGLELELEGRNVAMADVAVKGWGRHQDGSLRGEAVEYTTVGAVTFETAQKLVKGLFKKFEENKVKIKDSIRTSTHVHLNFSDKPLKAALNFFCLFTVLEEVLQHYSGEDRKGNVFCISTREAEGIMGVLLDAIRKMNFGQFAGDRYKYSACNLSTLYKFGTIEVRTMKGANSADQINRWLDILNDMYVYSLKKMETPVHLVIDLSILGAEALMRKIFSPANFQELMKTFPAPQTLHYSLMDGARVIQVFAYEFEEEFNAKVELKKAADEPAVKKVGVRWAAPVHGACSIFRPDGMRWNCFNVHGGPFGHGDRLEDCRSIYWDEAQHRFICQLENGNRILCNWLNSPGGINEGPPVHAISQEDVEWADVRGDEEHDEVEEWFDEEGDEN